MNTPNANHPFAQAIEKMHAKIAAALNGKRRIVIYAAYPDDASDLPIDNLNEIAVQGECRLIRKNHFKMGRVFMSEPVTNPTWLQVAVFANCSIEVFCDENHIFLEDLLIRQVDERSAIPLYSIYMGS